MSNVLWENNVLWEKCLDVTQMISKERLTQLRNTLKGESFLMIFIRVFMPRMLVYRKIPLAVACPREVSDIQQLIKFAEDHQTTLIPRTAGTSLAGQCVGDGIIGDVSKHFTRILAFDELEKTITVQPGVIRDELNLFLKPLDYGPNTSTSNRCMIGGMVGNNSSGSTSIRKYGVTRDKVLQIDGVLSDGTKTSFSELTSDEFKAREKKKPRRRNLYISLQGTLAAGHATEILSKFPKEYPQEKYRLCS